MGFVPISGTGRQFLLVAKEGRREVEKAFVGIAERREGRRRPSSYRRRERRRL